jgi:RNA polymerase sigma-70 factor, ECF subfamily
MSSTTAEELIAALFSRINAGDHSAKEELFVLVYDQLRRLAGSHFRGKPASHTLQPTALVHEAFMRLMRAEGGFQDRGHFLAVASVAMRQILTDHARRRNAAKRRAGERVSWDDEESESGAATVAIADGSSSDQHVVDILALDRALTKLATLRPRQARIVELRYFGGLTVEEVADLLIVSRQTVEKEWRQARAWLRAMLTAADEATNDEGDLQ